MKLPVTRVQGFAIPVGTPLTKGMCVIRTTWLVEYPLPTCKFVISTFFHCLFHAWLRISSYMLHLQEVRNEISEIWIIVTRGNTIWQLTATKGVCTNNYFCDFNILNYRWTLGQTKLVFFLLFIIEKKNISSIHYQFIMNRTSDRWMTFSSVRIILKKNKQDIIIH